MFSATTCHSGKLKAIFEILFSNAQMVCFTISETGISSETTTINNALIKVDLPATCFDEYVFTFTEPQYVGIGSHVNTFFKSIKNKTRVILAINHPFILDITTVNPVDEDCSTGYTLTLINSQNVAPIQSESYNTEPVLVSTTNFNSMCKSFSKSASIDVTKRDGQISFSFELTGISKRVLTFGKKNPDVVLFHHQFKSDAFSRIIKLSSFATDPILIYAEPRKPLLIKSKSSLGTIKIFIKFDD